MLGGKENNNNNNNYNKCDSASGSFKPSLRVTSPFSRVEQSEPRKQRAQQES